MDDPEEIHVEDIVIEPDVWDGLRTQGMGSRMTVNDLILRLCVMRSENPDIGEHALMLCAGERLFDVASVAVEAARAAPAGDEDFVVVIR